MADSRKKSRSNNSTRKNSLNCNLKIIMVGRIDFISDYEYRIKPKTKTIRFRNWISCSGNIYMGSESEQIGQNHNG